MSDLGETIDCLRQGKPERLNLQEAMEIASHLDSLDNKNFDLIQRVEELEAHILSLTDVLDENTILEAYEAIQEWHTRIQT